MAINKKLVHFKTFAKFNEELSAGNILDTSICWIKDTKQIWTHGQFYDCSSLTDEDIVGTTLVGYTESVEINENLDLTAEDTIVGAFGKLVKAIKDNEEVDSAAFVKLRDSVGLDENLEFSTSAGDSNVTEAIERIDGKIISTGDGTKFLADDGQYKEVGATSVTDERIVGSAIVGYTESVETGARLDLAQDDTIIEAFGKLSKSIKDNKSDASSTFATKEELNAKADSTAIADMATKTWVGQQGYLTEHQDISGLATKSELTSGLSGKQDKGDYALKSEIPDISNFITKDVSDLTNYYKKSDIESKLSGKSDTSHTHANATQSVSGFMSSADKAKLDDITASAAELNYCKGVTSAIQTQLNAKLASDYYTGHSTTTSYTIPTNKRLCIATLSSSGSLNVGSISDGRELHIIVKNGVSNKITITFPSNGYVKLSGDTLDIEVGAYAEINITSDGTTKYIRAVSRPAIEIPASQSSACDICLYDRTADKLIIVRGNLWSINLYPSYRYTPIGIVVVPGTHNVYGDDSCGVMSLKTMSCTDPQNGSVDNIDSPGSLNNKVSMHWGGYGSDISTLPNLNQAPIVGSGSNVGNASSTVTDEVSNPFLPSDRFSAVQCPHDTDVYYYSSSSSYNQAPSPYLTDGSRNPAYYQTTSPSSSSNALADFDGIGNTEKIITQRGTKDYNSWIPAFDSEADYPAASCCDMFYTEGTSQGDWYLPACGELGYIMPPFNKINDAIDKMCAAYGSSIGVRLPTGSLYYWSSTEYTRRVHMFDGLVHSYSKNGSCHVRAFLRVGGNE